MFYTLPEKIYINNKCVGNYPCYHFVTIEKEDKQYKNLMNSIQIYDLCHKLKIRTSFHIRNNRNISIAKEKCNIL